MGVRLLGSVTDEVDWTIQMDIDIAAFAIE